MGLRPCVFGSIGVTPGLNFYPLLEFQSALIRYNRVPRERFGLFKAGKGTAARVVSRAHVRSDWGAVRCEFSVPVRFRKNNGPLEL